MYLKVSRRTELEVELIRLFGIGTIKPITTALLKRMVAAKGEALGSSYAENWLARTLYTTGLKTDEDIRSDISDLGMFYDDGKTKFAFGFFKSPETGKICLHIVAPNNSTHLPEILPKLQAASGTQDVYIRNVGQQELTLLARHGYKKVTQKYKPYIRTAPTEDCTFPERIVDLQDTYSDNTRSKLARATKNLGGKNYELRPLVDEAAAKKLVEKHFAMLKNPIGSTADDYYSLIKAAIALQGQDGVFAYMAYVDNQPTGLYICQTCGKSEVAVLANIALREPEYFTYYSHDKLFEKLKEHGIRYANLSGSETKELDDYKKQWSRWERQTY